MKFLADTNIAIYQLKGRLAEQLPDKRAHNLKIPDAISVATARVLECILLNNDQQLAQSGLLETRSFPLRPG